MKRIAFTLLALGTMTSAHGAQPKISKNANKVFICAREVLESRRTESADIALVASILNAAANERDLETSHDQCIHLNAQLLTKPQRELDAIYADTLVLNQSGSITDGKAEAIRHIAANTYMECRTGGVSAEVVLGIGFGAGIGFMFNRKTHYLHIVKAHNNFTKIKNTVLNQKVR